MSPPPFPIPRHHRAQANPTHNASRIYRARAPKSVATVVSVETKGVETGRKAIVSNFTADDIITYTRENGGGTWYVPTWGFLVALGGRWGKVLPKAKATEREVAKFMREHYASLKGVGLYLGTWLDQSGSLHLDLVECVESRDEALELGRQRDQIAIWDLLHETEVAC